MLLFSYALYYLIHFYDLLFLVRTEQKYNVNVFVNLIIRTDC